MDLDFQPKLCTNDDGAFFWKPERVGQLQDQAGAIQPGEYILDLGWAADRAALYSMMPAVIADLDGYIRKMFAVPDDVTAENNWCFKCLRSAVVDSVFAKMGKVFREVLERSIVVEADNARCVI